MGTTIDTYGAKTHLSRLLDQVEAGEEVIITRRGRPVAKLVRVTEAEPPAKRRVLGVLRGQAGNWVPKQQDPDWQATLDALEAKWSGGGR